MASNTPAPDRSHPPSPPTRVAPIAGLLSALVLPADDLQVLATAALAAIAIATVRLLAVEMRRAHVFSSRVVVLGTGSMATTLIEEMDAAPDSRYMLAGIVSDERPLAHASRWLGPCDELAHIVERINPARIVVALDDRRGTFPLTPLLESRIRGVVVEDGLEFYERLTGKMAIEALTPGSLILAQGFRNHGTAQMVARIVGMSLAATALLLLAPVLLVIAIAIKLDSRGPVFFVQERIGKDGRPFPLLKFRTMHPCPRQRSEWVRDNEDRITRVGGLLRRCRADELPQLVNVLRGEMNLIGPRPHPTGNQQLFMDQIAYYGLRSVIAPGVTGWAQVRYGYANNLEEETEKMRYDLFYIKNRSFLLDLRIIAETIATMVMGGGASRVRRSAPRQLRSRRRHVRRSRGPVSVPWLVGSQPAEHGMGHQ